VLSLAASVDAASGAHLSAIGRKHMATKKKKTKTTTTKKRRGPQKRARGFLLDIPPDAQWERRQSLENELRAAMVQLAVKSLPALVGAYCARESAMAGAMGQLDRFISQVAQKTAQPDDRTVAAEERAERFERALHDLQRVSGDLALVRDVLTRLSRSDGGVDVEALGTAATEVEAIRKAVKARVVTALTGEVPQWATDATTPVPA
jgi:hypothetical protein